MTPARKAALQWFHDRGEVQQLPRLLDTPTDAIMARMIVDGQLTYRIGQYRRKIYHLTDLGRRMLSGDSK